MTKRKLKKGWFYDIKGQLTIKFMEFEIDAANWGDYYHHDWVGPFKTFHSAKISAMKELKFEADVAVSRLENFSELKEK